MSVRVGFKTHLAPSTVPSQCDLECGPKVIPWRGLRAGPWAHAGRGAPRVLHTSGYVCKRVYAQGVHARVKKQRKTMTFQTRPLGVWWAHCAGH